MAAAALVPVVEVELSLVHLADQIGLSLYEAVTVFAAKVRQGVLSRLVTTERTNRDELAEELAGEDRVPIADSNRLEVALHHYHLPKLADEQVLDYDPRTGDVVRWKEPRAIEARLDSS